MKKFLLLTSAAWGAWVLVGHSQGNVEQTRSELIVIARDIRNASFGFRGTPEEITAKAVAMADQLKTEPGRSVTARLALELIRLTFEDLPRRSYGRSHARQVIRIIARQVIFSIEGASSDDDMINKLRRDLALPQDAEMEALFPVDVPLEEFQKLGPVRIFLMKHRQRRPPDYTEVTGEDLAAGRYNVQKGVILRGRVTNSHFFAGDGDHVFNIGIIHNEITPIWRATHRGPRIPRNGDLVEIRGWSYYDSFHDEEGPDEQAIWEVPDENSPTGKRWTRPNVWEVHPVTDVRVIERARSRRSKKAVQP